MRIIKTMDRVITRKNGLLFLLFILFVLFLDTIKDSYNQKIVEGVLSKISSYWMADVVFLLLAIITVLTAIHFAIKRKKVNNYFFFFGVFFFALFFYCRVFSNDYSYESYYWFSSLKYIDYLFLLFGTLFLFKVWNWFNTNKEPVYKKEPFLIDKPLSPGDVDKFGRKDFAKKIAEKIQSRLKVEDAGALAIGINGAWGSGKTSFANMIKEQIDEKNRLVVEFNPWRSSSASKIIEDFFELIISELKRFDPKLSTSISTYAKSLTKIEENIITKSAESISDILFEELNKNEAYDSINNSIRHTKKQIIVFIDDLDRLDKKEIIEVLRIVRNTANFNNVVYVVSYDKGYIHTAIKDFNEYNFKSFLEKIFQFEFTLPMYEHGVLRTEIKRLLKEGLDEKFHTQIDRVVDSKEFHGVNFTNEIVRTYRDVIRLVNSLLFEIESIKEEVFFYDFYLLQLLKLEFPKVYEALINNRHLFFTTDGDKETYRLKTEKEAWTSDDVLSFGRAFKNNAYNQPHKEEEESETSFAMYLKDIQKELELTEYDKNLINYLLKTLLELKGTQKGSEDFGLYKSFAYPANFHKYFAFRLYEGDISAKEFEDSRKGDFEDYKNKVLEWIEEGKFSILIDRLEKVEGFASEKEFENHILILLEIGRIQINENVNNSYWVDTSLISKNLKYPTENSRKIKVYSDIEDYRKFLIETFKSAPKPPMFESLVIGRLIASRIPMALTSEELSEINFDYFKEYCNDHDEVTTEFRRLHEHAIRQADGYDANYEVIPEAQQIFEKYFLANLSGSGLSGLIRHTNPGSDMFHLDLDWIRKLFDEPVWESLEQYLENAENIKKEKEDYDEFCVFYKKTKANNYNPVEFDFKYLKPNLWTGGTKSNPTY